MELATGLMNFAAAALALSAVAIPLLKKFVVVLEFDTVSINEMIGAENG